jgi:RNA polymerase sigma factor (sigma-70 family)
VAALPQIGRASRVERPVAPGVDAAGDLYERYSAQILGYCLHQLGSREEAEDAVQTTFMNAFRGLQRGIVPELESAWLFKIAHNVCLSRRRSSWRRGKVEAPNNLEVLQEVIPGREQVSDELIRLQDVLEEMPETQRRAILLREWQGLTYREISAELGLTQAAVETLIFRARRALAQGLEQNADTWKRRLRRGADVGGAITFVKALIGGGGAAAVKVAVTAIAVATTAVTAATEMPRQVHHAAAARPAAAAKTTKRARRLHTLAATSPAPDPAPLLARRAATHATRTQPAERSLPKPVTLPPSDTATPPPTTPPATAPAAPSAQQPAQTQPELPAATAVAAPTPPAQSDNGKGKKDDRTPQATTQPTETTPVPPTTAPPADPPPAQTEPEPGPAQDTGKGKPDKADKPDHGHGNANGNDNGNSDKGPGHSDKHDNGKGGK